jgi:hypothetical protein
MPNLILDRSHFPHERLEIPLLRKIAIGLMSIPEKMVLEDNSSFD